MLSRRGNGTLSRTSHGTSDSPLVEPTLDTESLRPRGETGQHRSGDHHRDADETDATRRVDPGLEAHGEYAVVAPTGEFEQSVRDGEVGDAGERTHDGAYAQQCGQRGHQSLLGRPSDVSVSRPGSRRGSPAGSDPLDSEPVGGPLGATIKAGVVSVRVIQFCDNCGSAMVKIEVCRDCEPDKAEKSPDSPIGTHGKRTPGIEKRTNDGADDTNQLSVTVHRLWTSRLRCVSHPSDGF